MSCKAEKAESFNFSVSYLKKVSQPSASSRVREARLWRSRLVTADSTFYVEATVAFLGAKPWR
jgi:hypothetical protein